MKKIIPVVLLLWLTPDMQAQKLDKQARARIEKQILDKVGACYIDTKNAPAIVAALEKKFKTPYYDTVTQPRRFANRVTDDLQALSGDRHFELLFRPRGPEAPDSAAEEAAYWKTIHYENYQFARAEYYPGGIGYLRIDEFHPLEKVRFKIDGALNFLASANYLVIDLRGNSGGSGETVHYLMGCLFPYQDPPLHVGTLVSADGKEQKFFTGTADNSPHLSDCKVYLLTSGYTFSAAEEFAYDMQALKKAVVIGQSTAGGANPTERFDLGNDLRLVVPAYRFEHAVTKTNWEGRGVQPDIPCAEQEAFVAALKAIRKEMSDPGRAARLDFLIMAEEAKVHPVLYSENDLRAFAGTYAKKLRTISCEDGAIYSQRKGGPKFRLLALTKDVFYMEGTEARIEFLRDETGKVTRMKLVTNNGEEFFSDKDTD